jgi:hypothetical protein
LQQPLVAVVCLSGEDKRKICLPLQKIYKWQVVFFKKLYSSCGKAVVSVLA